METVKTEQFIRIKFSDLPTLAACYMPFITNGGLFIPGSRDIAAGSRVVVQLSVPDLPPVMFSSDVIWLSPPGMPGNKPPGFAVQLPGSASNLRQKLDNMADMLNNPPVAYLTLDSIALAAQSL